MSKRKIEHDGVERFSGEEALLKRTKLIGNVISADITLPPSTGTLALVADIPDNSDFVDLTSSQSISGQKTFSTAPIISTISNTGTLTLPSITTTLVGTDTTDTLSNKTLSTPNIENGVNIINSNLTFKRADLSDACTFLFQNEGITISEARGGATNSVTIGGSNVSFVSGNNTINLPSSASTLVGRDTTDLLLNKDLRSLTNSFPQEIYFKFSNSNSQSIPNNSPTTLTSFWNGTQANLGSSFSYSGGIFTINQNGVYLFSASLQWASAANGVRLSRIRASTGQIFDSTAQVGTTASFINQAPSGIMALAPGDTVFVEVYQTSGAALNVTSGPYPSHSMNGVLLFKI